MEERKAENKKEASSITKIKDPLSFKEDYKGYTYGNRNKPKETDCSGLVLELYRKAGYNYSYASTHDIAKNKDNTLVEVPPS
jgi:cell wall-associated NlpC family hydrolase